MASIKTISISFGRETVVADVAMTNGHECRVIGILKEGGEVFTSESKEGETFENFCFNVIRGAMNGITDVVVGGGDASA